MNLFAKRPSWLVIAVFVLGLGALFSLVSGSESSSAPQQLPADSQSYRATELAQGFPGGDTLPAILVFHSARGPLSPEQIGALQSVPGRAASAVDGAQAVSPVIPVNDTTAQATLTLPGELSGFGVSDAVKALRTSINDAAIPGVDAYVTGPAGFAADTAAVFDGANFALLGVTALVVAVLLIATYRSPILWLVPLTVTALADRAAALVTGSISEATGWFASDGSTAGITSVLVFGAGTNYALLLVSRYREELLTNDDSHHALHRAWRATLPAIISSNLTVVLALQTLWFASVPAFRSLGASASIGLLIALLFALTLLPAALNVCGRGLFWPKVPRVGHTNNRTSGFESIARGVNKRPHQVLTALTVLLLGLGFGISGTRIGLEPEEQFRSTSEAVNAAALLDASSPIDVYAPTGDMPATLDAIRGIPGAQLLGEPVANTDGTWKKATLTVDTADTTPTATVEDIRDNAPRGVIVGGQAAQIIDAKAGTLHDMKVIIPLIFLAVLLVLVVLLRALVAPVILLLAAALSTWAAIGTGTFISTHIFGFPGMDLSAPLYSILFLIALGIDYTVFLVLRAQEEAHEYGTKEGMVRAVGVTGGVITSAGIVLAAVFAALGVLPLITLTQVGILVGFGIVLDTFVVRTLVIPALFAILRDAMWWPRRQQEP
ncbi:MMPL family transporter [Corynebacterium argentoratense]|uniref:MMPL family transporter n=1 Tax=Corynebacterium argentoratense TaxID=42817 RepID=UPI001F2A8729|nr:MMPL family transporter [Corynebacterium argentoratense]MCF1766213.1 MMPL family transporter [Corynebacterium argentoratense]